MELRLLKTFVFVLLIHCVSAKRYSGGRSKSSGSRPRPSTSWGHTPTHTSHSSFSSRPSSKPNSGQTSSSSFLHAESGRPSLPANSHPSGFHTPSAPSHPTNTHTSSFGKPSGVVHEQHQQNSAPTSHSNPYERQPAYNPHVNNPYGSHGNAMGSHSSPPYPLNQPNHPLPSNVGSSSFPSNGAFHPPASGAYHPPTNGVYHPPTNGVYHPPMNGAYHPSSNGAYHPPMNGAYHPSSNGAYNPPMNGAYHPSSNGAYHPSSNGAYHPPANAVYHPPTYSQAPQHYTPPASTVYVIPDSRGKSSSPGIGTYIASGVAGGVAAGATNAIVDHAISSIFRPNSHGVHTFPSAPAPGTPTTSITNNYYYNNNGAPAAAPAAAPANNGAPVNQPDQTSLTNSFNGQSPQVAPAQNAPSTTNNQGTIANNNGGSAVHSNGVVGRGPGQLAHPDESNVITDDQLMKLSEDMFDNLNTNINQYVELNLQKRAAGIINDKPLIDEASDPLFIIKTGLDSIPTVSKLKALYDSYQRNGTQKEIVSIERRNKENEFLEEVMKTPIMKNALNWLSQRNYVKPNEYDQKELLKNTWFTVFQDTSSAFERIFLSENMGDGGLMGMQDWIYFAHLEGKNMVDYMGYVDMLSLSGKGALLKVNLQSEGVSMQALTMFVGTPPELAMALYTVCMHARYGGYCPVSLGGAKFFIFSHGFKENNNYLIDVGYPLF